MLVTVDDGVDRDDLAGERLIGQGVERHGRGLADLNLGRVGLGEGRLDLQGAHVHQRDEAVATARHGLTDRAVDSADGSRGGRYEHGVVHSLLCGVDCHLR